MKPSGNENPHSRIFESFLMKCGCDPCHQEAIFKVEWGSTSLSYQTADLCQSHLDELWGMLNPLLQLNRAWFTMSRLHVLQLQQTCEPKNIKDLYEEFEMKLQDMKSFICRAIENGLVVKLADTHDSKSCA